MPYYLYILRMSNGQYYIGTTSDLSLRSIRHFTKQAARTTAVLGADEFLYSETHINRIEAEKRERQIKGWSHAKKTALIKGDFEELKRLSKRGRRIF